jgi:5'-3' exonuclease
MILIDTSRMVIAAALNEAGYSPKNSSEENSNLIKHIFFNMLRIYNKTYSRKYGQLVFAIDSRKYWRKEIFPYYKEHRKKKREDSVVDWELVFKIKDELVSDLIQYFPYHVMEIDGAEADDIIAVLSRTTGYPHLIIATDHDVYQLLSENVHQYDPKKKEFVKLVKPVDEFLREHIVGGDSGDGIPNIKSVSNSFVDKIRQKPISKPFLKDCVENGVPEEFLDRYYENEKLIDLNMIPENIVSDIISKWKNKPTKDGSKVFNYLARNKYRLLLQDIGDF